jgi:hypothetical protein
MKKTLHYCSLVVTMTAMAQSVAVSDDDSVAEQLCILEVKSQLRFLRMNRFSVTLLVQ